MQLTRNDIIEKLREILLSADDRDPELIRTCGEDARLVSDLGMSSVSILYMVIAIEEIFGIRFENVGMSDFKTLADVVDYIEAALG